MINLILLKNGLGYKVFWDKDNDIIFTSHNNDRVPQKWLPCKCISGLICGTVSNTYTIHHYFDDDEEVRWDLPIELKLTNASKRNEISFEEALSFAVQYNCIGLLNEIRHGHAKLKELKWDTTKKK